MFVGYKYVGGSYRVWDPEREVMVELWDIIFFEDGLPPPALHDTTGFNADADDPIKQSRPMDCVSPQIVPTQAHAPSPVRTLMTDFDMADVSPAPQHPRLVVHLPGRHMDQGALHHRHTPSDGIIVASGGDSDSDNRVVFNQLIHNVTHLPDYLERTLRSGRRRGPWDGSIPGLERGGGGGGDALFVADLRFRTLVRSHPAAPTARGVRQRAKRRHTGVMQRASRESIEQMYTLWLLHLGSRVE